MSKQVYGSLVVGNKKFTHEKLKEGPCIFPFKFKGETQNECIKGKKGDWCATEINNEQERKMTKYAFCDYNYKPKKTKIRMKPAASAPAPTKKVLPNKDSKKKIMIKPVKKQTNIEDPSAEIDKDYRLPIVKTLQPKLWELPNRKTFPKWVFENYKVYQAQKNSLKSQKGDKLDYFKHQKLVRDYLQKDSPYRGILLYHGLGVGKTCASIAIAEGFRGDRKIAVILNKSLKQNFIVNLMKCGFEYFKINQHWEFKEFKESDVMNKFSAFLGISPVLIKKNGGAWFVNYSKKPNYEELSTVEQNSLSEQINKMISSRYTFYHMDGLNKDKLEKMNENRVLDNKLLIIDEVHNLTNAMAKTFPGIRAKGLKKLIMGAKNLRCVFLSGTPMINSPYEAGQLFNLLRGHITKYTFALQAKAGTSNMKKVADVLRKEIKQIDQIFIDERESLVSVTRNPIGFVTSDNNDGLINSPDNKMGDKEFIEMIIGVLGKLGYNIKNRDSKNYTAFPDDEGDFMKLFFDEENNELKNPKLFQTRILGLVSHFRTQDKDLLPTVTKDEVIEVEMSKYQFMKYAEVRKKEIEQDKNKKNKGKASSRKKSEDPTKGNLFEDKSSFRAYSRMHCSFVFPDEIKRPLPKGSEDDVENIVEIEQPIDEDDDLNEEQLDRELRKRQVKAYDEAKIRVLTKFNMERNKYLVANEPEQLMRLSPKYNAIINKINESPGLAFVYTEYRTLEGIAIFEIILRANGYAPFLLEKNENGDLVQVYEDDSDIAKPKFAFWGGDEERSDIVRKIYNNEFEELPSPLKEQISKKGTQNNLRGDIMKILMTTKSGAEGIDLKNVRQVHIVEPYWNPVRTKQVKGRAVRVGSHIQLPPADRTVEIYTYLSKISDEDLLLDKNIQADAEGKSSDQVLFNIAGKKLLIMEHLLKLIKESSMDCNLNREETVDLDNAFTCMSYGSQPSRDEYTYLPNIMDEHIDTERRRRVKQATWEPIFIKLTIKGKPHNFAVKRASKKGDKNLLYDAEEVKVGIVGRPLGHYIEKEDGKKKFSFYKVASGKKTMKGKSPKNKGNSSRRTGGGYKVNKVIV